MTARTFWRSFLAAFTGPRTVPDRDPKGRGQAYARGAADGVLELWAGVRKDRESTTDNRSELGKWGP